MTLVEKDVNPPSCQVLGNYLANPCELLVADDHERWISSQLYWYLVVVAKASEGQPDRRETFGKLLIPSGKSIFGGYDKKFIPGVGSEHKSSESFGRLSSTWNGEGGPGRQGSEEADISYLMFGKRTTETSGCKACT